MAPILSRSALRSLTGVLCLLSASVAAADNGYIDILIVNDGDDDQRVAVIDNICNRQVLEKRIIADGELPAQVCAREMGRGDVTVRNLATGGERRERNLLDGDRIATP
jgi:hypothetical protein